MTSAICAFFFFFQAEDGIRDVAVTGVQTCALPIYGGLHPRRDTRSSRDRPSHGGPGREARECRWRPIARPAGHVRAALAGCLPEVSRRSEERRVGKECRSRWSPYH